MTNVIEFLLCDLQSEAVVFGLGRPLFDRSAKSCQQCLMNGRLMGLLGCTGRWAEFHI